MNKEQEKELQKISVEDFAKLKYISNPQFSPNGKNACFVVSNANMEQNKYESYIYAKKGDSIIRLTGLGKEASYFFLDDDNILFNGNRDFDDKKPSCSTKFYKINLNGGEAELYLELPIPAFNTKFLKNGNILFLTSTDPLFPDLYLNDEKYKADYQKHLEENKDYEEIEESPWWFNGDTFTKGARTSLMLYKKEDKKIERLTDPKFNVGNIYLSKEEDILIYSGFNGDKALDIFKSDYYQFDLNTKESKKIINKEEFDCNGIIERINGKTYFLANRYETGLNTDNDFYSVNENGEIQLEKKFAQTVGGTVGSDVRRGGGKQKKVVGEDFYFVSTQFDSSILMKYNMKNNKITKVIEKEGALDAFDVYGDKVLLVALYDMKPQELYEYDLKKKEMKQLTFFNDEYVNNHFISAPEELFFQSKKDLIHGFICKPIHYDESKKYPVILDVHGGPKTVYGKVFYHEMQYWCSEGYFVIYCNPTGGDGRGRKFADIRGKYGTIDYEDIMNFCDVALEKYPQMDAANFFETGGSYGGFMTNWIIGHTDRFKACASQRSISNWISFYGLSDIGTGFATDQTAADIWKNHDKMWFHSPLKYAPNVKTPTLFIHSAEDYRCPMPEGMQMFNALLAHGVDSKLVYFRGENHDLSRTGLPKHRLKRLNEITGWFNKYLDDQYKVKEKVEEEKTEK